MRRIIWILSMMAIIGVLSFAIPTTQAEIVAQSHDTGQLQGMLTILYGDPAPNSSDPVITQISLLDVTTGATIAHLRMGIGLAHTYAYQTVQVDVARLSRPASGNQIPTYLVQGITPIVLPNVDSPQGNISTPQYTGSQRFINLLCKFSDRTSEPRTPIQYAELFNPTYGSVNHFWTNVSYNMVNLNGSTTVSMWRSLPYTRNYYTSPLKLFELLQDCATLFDDVVNFNDVVGVNIMLNDTIGCCAWGGGGYITTNEGFKIIRATWNPPWAQNVRTLAHEIGHALGLPHSSGPWDNPPTELSIYVSQWDVMSNGGTCNQTYGIWGCVPAGTIAYYLTLNNWLSASRQVSVLVGGQATFTLRRLNANVGSGYVLAKVPINDSTTNFYTVEVRDNVSSYDVNVPNTAVVIHYVDLTIQENTGPALVVDAVDGNDDVNDAGAQWQPGEIFTDTANAISIRVVSRTGSDYVVEIKNNAMTILATFTENQLLAALQAQASLGISYYLVNFYVGNAEIYANINGEVARVVISVTNRGGGLARFVISQMTAPDGRTPLTSETIHTLNTHLLAHLNNALNSLITARLGNINIDGVFFSETEMSVGVAD